MNERAFRVMTMWAETFPKRQSGHFVFPTEKHGKPPEPALASRSGSTISGTRLVLECSKEAGVPLSVVATLAGRSPSTAVRMSRRYGHIGQAAQREAVKALEAPTPKPVEPPAINEEIAAPVEPAKVQ